MKTQTRRLVAEIPADLFKELKVTAVMKNVLMKDLVAFALRQYLKGGKSKKK